MNDNQIRQIVDFSNAKECFPTSSISGGVCYFVWKKNSKGNCQFTNIHNGLSDTMTRPLNEFPVLIRYNKAVSIVHKVLKNNFTSLETIISPLMPFGLKSNYRGATQKKQDADLALYASNSVTYIDKNEIKKGQEYISKYKVLLSKTGAEHAVEPDKNGMFRIFTASMRVIGPNEVCTHSYFLVGAYDTKREAENALKYLKTKFLRLLVLLAMNSINLSKHVFPFVPIQDFTSSSDIDWSQSVADIDRQLYTKYRLDEKEISFIESHVKEMK